MCWTAIIGIFAVSPAAQRPFRDGRHQPRVLHLRDHLRGTCGGRRLHLAAGPFHRWSDFELVRDRLSLDVTTLEVLNPASS